MRWLIALALCGVAGGIGYVCFARSRVIVCGEDGAMLRRIADAAISYHADPAGPGTLPQAVGPTPPRLCVNGVPEQPADPSMWQHPTWVALGIEAAEPLFYQYSFIPDASGRGFVVRAEGDLDCDGVRSVQVHRWAVDDAGLFTRVEMRHEREGE